MTTTTKKMPMSISFADAKASGDEFVIPALHDECRSFLGLKSRKTSIYAAVTYIGQEITVNDVFARLVDSGQKIESVEKTLKMLEDYLEAVQSYRIGNVLTVEPSSDRCGFKLTKVAQKPNSEKKRLP